MFVVRLLRAERVERVLPEPLHLALLEIHVRIAGPIGRRRGRGLGGVRYMMALRVLGSVGRGHHRSGEQYRQKGGLHVLGSHSIRRP